MPLPYIDLASIQNDLDSHGFKLYSCMDPYAFWFICFSLKNFVSRIIVLCILFCYLILTLPVRIYIRPSVISVATFTRPRPFTYQKRPSIQSFELPNFLQLDQLCTFCSLTLSLYLNIYSLFLYLFKVNTFLCPLFFSTWSSILE